MLQAAAASVPKLVAALGHTSEVVRTMASAAILRIRDRGGQTGPVMAGSIKK
jgi:hypothetical protein